MFPGVNVPPSQPIPQPPPPPQYQAPSQGQQGQPMPVLPPYLTPMIRPNQSAMLDQVNQSMVNNLSFQSERTPLSQNNASIFSIPASASAMNQPAMNQPAPPQPLPQQQPQIKTQQIEPPRPVLPTTTTTVAPTTQAQTNGPLFKPVGPLFNQPPPQTTVTTTAPAAQAQKPSQPFSFGSLLSKPVEPKPEPPKQQAQPQGVFSQPARPSAPFSFANLASATSTPQPPPPLNFSKLAQQQTAQPPIAQPPTKPPLFQLSPNKPVTTEAAKPATSIFGPNLFKPAETKT